MNTSYGSRIVIPPSLGHLVSSEEELFKKVFPSLKNNFRNTAWLKGRAILDSVNEALLREIDGDLKIYKSIDTVTNDTEVTEYPSDVLNSLTPAGMPSHRLALKIGAPIMLIRNLDPPKLCNGTRLQVTQLFDRLVEAKIMIGQFAQEKVLIPRIPMIPSDFPIEFKRLQFPLKMSFAMSINKSQGQTLDVAGVHLKNPCFSHGQLYVALSRVGSPDKLFILPTDSDDGSTENVVYREMLCDE